MTSAAGLAASAALSSAPPVGALPNGPTKAVSLAGGATFTATLPKAAVAGRVWRIARAYDAAVVREVREGESKRAVWVTFRAVAPGTTTVVFALTRGETAHAYAARSFRLVVAKRRASASGCPRDLLPLTANSIGPAVVAALIDDSAKNRPQVTRAAIAPEDAQRGPEAKARCGATVWRRTVVVSITDRALLPSQSLSQRVLFVGRTPAGYRVWRRVH
jgi:CelD/BcsL family acetyltransferase involved in cellulose biosynthesis